MFLLPVTNIHPAWSAGPAPELKTNSTTATAGFYTLSWQSDADSFELEEATDSRFQSAQALYRGPDLSSVRSGIANGQRYYRVRAINNNEASNWSNTVQVDVIHHSLSRAFGFLAVGIFVFLATVVMIVRGASKE